MGRGNRNTEAANTKETAQESRRADRDIKGKGAALAVGARQPKYSGSRHKGATELRAQPRLGELEEARQQQ